MNRTKKTVQERTRFLLDIWFYLTYIRKEIRDVFLFEVSKRLKKVFTCRNGFIFCKSFLKATKARVSKRKIWGWPFRLTTTLKINSSWLRAWKTNHLYFKNWPSSVYTKCYIKLITSSKTNELTDSKNLL